LLNIFFIFFGGWGGKSDQNNTILKTVDGGKNWIAQDIATISHWNSVFFINENIGWIVGDGGKILKTINGGDNWNEIKIGSSGKLTSIYAIDENRVWIVGPGQVFMIDN